MSDLELQITSDHPWYHTVWEAALDLMYGKNTTIPTINAAITISGVEEFYRLDSIYAVTSWDHPGQRVYNTVWNKVR